MSTHNRDRRTALYRVVNKLTGDDYIGVTVDPKRRWRVHKSDAQLRGSKLHFHRALVHYGPEAFEWSVVAWCCTYDGALRLEKFARALGMGAYNMTQGGEGALGRSPSSETRAKTSATKKGFRHADISRQRMSLAKKGRPAHNKGVPASEDQKRKQREKMKGRPVSAEALENLRLGRLVRWAS